MPATPLSEKPAHTSNGSRLPDYLVLERVRAAFLNADRHHTRRPGRPALVEDTGGTEHQVRRAMRIAGYEIPQAVDLATQASPDPHQDGTVVETPAQPPAPPEAPPPQASAAPDDQSQPPPSVLSESHRPAEEAAPPPERAADANDHRVPNPPSAWPLGFIGLAAAVAVWGGWVDLGRFTGFGMVQPLPGLVDGLRINTAIVLPIGIEAYGGYALRTWLSSAALSARTRSYAGWSALVSLVVGGGAQVASHLMKAHSVTVAPWWVTVVVSCVPVAVLGLATGLATLVRQDTTSSTT